LTIVDYKGHRRLEAEFGLLDKLKFGKIQLATLRENIGEKNQTRILGGAS